MLPNPFRFIAAVGRLLKAFVLRRRLFVPREVRNARIAVCEAGSGSCFDPYFRRCLDCTCFVDLKAEFATERCPRKLWRRELFRTVG
jgi:hypothetical protein